MAKLQDIGLVFCFSYIATLIALIISHVLDDGGDSKAMVKLLPGEQTNTTRIVSKKPLKKRLKARNKFIFFDPKEKKGRGQSSVAIDRGKKTLDIGRRFPAFGSSEFDKLCPWTTRTDHVDAARCKILVKNTSGGNEGVSQWVSNVAHGFIFAQLAGCKFLADYDGNVEVQRVFVPADESNMDWRVNTDFICEKKNACYHLGGSNDVSLRFPFKIPGVDNIASIPNYRWAYSGSTRYQITRSKYAALAQKLPGFSIKNGMACALGSLFALAPTAADFEPNLFTEILPTLNDKKSLVLSLYIRTGRTDEIATKEATGDTQIQEENVHGYADDIIDCARSIEQTHIADTGSKFDRIVWMVVSDGPKLKQHIQDNYGGKRVGKDNAGPMRNVMLTGARGIHTRPKRKPSTRDFAEALIDLLVIGESDALVANPHLSFGFTGALRTNRPFFDANHQCGKRIMVVEK